MIKGDYFLKLLKPLFSILLIGFFGLLGNSFVNAGVVSEVSLYKYASVYDNQYKLGFLKGGAVLTDYLGQGKSVLAFSSNKFFWWATNGQPYFYSPDYQGFFSQYGACDEITGVILGQADYTPQNCSFTNLTGDYQTLFNSFFKKIDFDDYTWYNFVADSYSSSSSSGRKRYVAVCWSSREVGTTLCFAGEDCWQAGGGGYYCSDRLGAGGLIDSQNLQNLSYGLISNFRIGRAPGQVGYGDFAGDTEGSVDVNIDSSYTGDYTYSECTNGSIMNYAERSGISPYLCQGGLDNWDLFTLTGIYNPVPGSGKRLDEIYGYTTNSGQTSAKDWFNYRQPIYVNQYVGNQNVWLNQPAVLRSYFKIYNDYGGQNFDFNTIYEYCLMRKFYSWDHDYATHKYQGQYFKKSCTYIQNNQISDNEGGNAGESVIGLNWNGVGNLSGGKTYNEPGQFITDMFTKIKSYIPTDRSYLGAGILPTYIITFLLFLILFRFLSH